MYPIEKQEIIKFNSKFEQILLIPIFGKAVNKKNKLDFLFVLI